MRLGTDYGGWYIPLDSGLHEESVCYCVGAGEDISFDCALAERFRCHIRIIDPTPRAIKHFRALQESVRQGTRFPVNNSSSEFYEITEHNLRRVLFLPVGLAESTSDMKFYFPQNRDHVSCSIVNLQKTEEYFTAQCKRLADIMREQNHTHIDLLKMDIEGAECSVIRDIVQSSILPRLLLIEFDEIRSPLDDDSGLRIKEHIDLLLRAGYICIAVDGSNATFIRNH
jgi:FkbM family methyltransferase